MPAAGVAGALMGALLTLSMPHPGVGTQSEPPAPTPSPSFGTVEGDDPPRLDADPASRGARRAGPQAAGDRGGRRGAKRHRMALVVD